MATYVLVHGAGHGGWCFQRVTPLLEAEGHTAYCPTLTGLGERAHLVSPEVDLDTHITDVVNLLFYEDLNDVVLVGHSYGGLVVKGIADRARDRIAKLVFLDAPDGQSQTEAFPVLLEQRKNSQIIDGVEMVFFPSEHMLGILGVTDPADVEWALPRCTPQPWKTLEQRIVIENESALNALPQYQIVATTTLGWGLHSEALLSKARAGGRYWEIDGGHDLMITKPGVVADLLLQIASADVGQLHAHSRA